MADMLNIIEIEGFAVKDGDGIRSVVFCKGCSMHCPWCANPESQKSEKSLLHNAKLCRGCGRCTRNGGGVSLCDGKIVLSRGEIPDMEKTALSCPFDCYTVSGEWISPETLAKKLLRDKDYFVDSGGGVTFSGGEMFLQPHAVLEVAKILKKEDINIACETCGFFPTANLEMLIDYIDTFYFDIKHSNQSKLKAETGGDLQLILKNLDYIISHGKRLVVRIPVVPDFNYSTEEITEILKLVASRGVSQVELLPYHTLGIDKYAKLGLEYSCSRSMLSPIDLAPFAKIAEGLGLEAYIQS